MLEERPGRDQGVPDPGRRQRRVGAHEVVQPRGLLPQGLLRAGRQHPGHRLGDDRRSPVPAGGGLSGPRCGGLFEDDVGVGAAHADRGHPCPARPAGFARPGPRGAQHLEVVVEAGDGGVGGGEVRGGDQMGALHAQRGLHEADDARGRLQVADVGLHRADGEPAAAAARAEHLPQARQFGRVAEPGAGAVGLDVVDVLERDARAAHGGQHGRGLPGGAGVRYPGGGAAAVHAPAAHHRVDGVAVGDGEVEPFQDDERAALAAGEAVGPCVEGEAAAVGRERAQVRQARSGLGVDDQVHASGDRHVHRAAADPLAGQRQRHQGGGLARVRAQAHAADVEQVRDPVGDQRAAGAERGVAVVPVAAGQLAQQFVAGGPGADHDVDLAAGQGGGREAGVLDGLPGEFEAQPLHGVHGCGFPGRDVEEGGVEAVDGLEERARVQGGGVRVGPVGGLCVGGPLRGEGADGRPSLVQQVPELGHAVHTGEAARHPDHGNIGGCATHECSFRFLRCTAGTRGAGALTATSGCTALTANGSAASTARPARS